MAALPKNIVDGYLSCLKLADLKPTVFEIESSALARALIKDGETPSCVLIIDLGATMTRFVVFAGQNIRFSSSISVSSQNLTEAIARNLGISGSEAEKLKRKYGLEEKTKFKKMANPLKDGQERGKLFDAMIPVLVDLIQQIKKHLDYYQTHEGHEHGLGGSQRVSKLLLCGGGASLHGLPELLSLELKIPVELANPWINVPAFLQKRNKQLSPENQLEYATAVGLALRNFKKN